MENDILDNFFVKKPKKRFSYTLFYIWTGLLVLGVFFKIQHWPLAGLFLLVSYAGLLSHSLIGVLFFKMRDYPILFFVLFGLYHFIQIMYGIFFLNGKPYNIYGATIYTAVLVGSFFIEYAYFQRRN
jgi:hypothetical protein